jgi:hypothetical protein
MLSLLWLPSIRSNPIVRDNRFGFDRFIDLSMLNGLLLACYELSFIYFSCLAHSSSFHMYNMLS